MMTPSPQPTERVSLETFKKLDLRVAEIVSVVVHPNADRLWVLTIRVGNEEKQIVAGIRAHYDADTLKGRSVVVVNNLEPAVIRGVESQGMMLVASNDQGLSILVPDRPIAPGSCIH